MAKMFHGYGEVQLPTSKPNENDGTSYDCDMCDSGDWLSETEVELHKKSVHIKQLTELVTSKSNVCLTCAKSFTDHNAVIEHIKSNHLHSSKTARRIEREIFICSHCEQIFFNKQLLALHIVHRHMKKTHSIVLNCPLCLKRKNSRVMYNHLLHHNLQSITICPICLHKQRNTKALALHLETHLKHYHCNICGYISTKEKDFNMHLDMYERRKKCFKLSNYKEYFLNPVRRCRWSYNTLKIGLQGLVIYNEIYICVLCRQLCGGHTDMQEHILRDHSSEPDIGATVAKKVCSCGEQFSNTIMLKYHILKKKGQCRLSYTEIDQSAGEDSSDSDTGLPTNTEDREVNPAQELIYQCVGAEEYTTEVTIVATDTQNAESDTQDLEKDMQILESDTQDLGNDTQNLESDTQDLENDTQNVESDTQDLEKDTQNLESDTQDLEKDTQNVERDTQDLEKETQIVESDTQDAENGRRRYGKRRKCNTRFRESFAKH